MAKELPPHVEAFIARYLQSVDDLDLLAKLVEESDRWWDADVIVRELGISKNEAQRALERLATANLLEVRLTVSVRYRFHPGSDDVKHAATACADIYRDNPVAVVRAIARDEPRRRARTALSRNGM